MLFLLLLALSRPYWPVSIAAIPTSTRTHVQVEGIVGYVSREADGDIHFRLLDPQKRFVICEIIPLIPLAKPKVGQQIQVQGIRRFDSAHKWGEVHPVEHWIPLP